MARTFRSNALEKLARLSAQSPVGNSKNKDFERLYNRCPKSPAVQNGTAEADGSAKAHTATKIHELEAVLALCKAAPFVESIEVATPLLERLSSYLPGVYSLTLSPSPSLRGIEPSPYEALSYNLTSAILLLGTRHSELRQTVTSTITSYMQGWTAGAAELSTNQIDDDGRAESKENSVLSRLMTQSLSLLGFLDAAAEHTKFWTAHERLQFVDDVKGALSEQYLISFETALSIVRNARPHQHGMSEWKRYAKHYAAVGRPLGAMILHDSFLKVVVTSASMLVESPAQGTPGFVLDHLRVSCIRKQGLTDISDDALAEGLTRIAVTEMERLDNDLEYLQRVGSAWQQRQASSVKAKILITYLCCTVYDEELADAELLMNWLDNVLNDPTQSADHGLASTALKSMAVLAQVSSDMASTLGRSLPRLIVQANFDHQTTSVAAESLAAVLSLLPQDAIITTLYSLGNVISAGSSDRNPSNSPALNGSSNTLKAPGAYTQHANGSAISLTPSDAEEPHHVHTTVVETIVSVARNCKDDKITALALSMLMQKIGRANKSVDVKIITEAAFLGSHTPAAEFNALLKRYSKYCHDALVNNDTLILEAIMAARLNISKEVATDSAAFEIYLTHLLDTIVSKGDASESAVRKDSEHATQEIAQLLKPLAMCLAHNAEQANSFELDDTVISLQRDAWFNIVIHGFDMTSELGKHHIEELRTLARFSKPLIVEEQLSQAESTIELNTVLRRGKSPEHTAEQKRRLAKLLPSCEADTRPLTHPEVVFLNTAYLVEDLRASTGDCSKALSYFLDPKLRSGAVGNCMAAICRVSVSTYLSKTLCGNFYAFSTPYLAQQLAKILAACCHRIARVQQEANACADMIIQQMPSTLCQKSALFALLELLSIMWYSCLEGDTDEYSWNATYTSKKSSLVKVELSDDYAFRRKTLDALYKHAKVWIKGVLDSAPLDIKGLLQTYLSEFDDETSYGHVSLGRSFALEMGSVVPSTDQRLGAIERQGITINTASDFITQYTTRQEYKFLDGFNDQQEEWLRDGQTVVAQQTYLSRSLQDATNLLVDLENRTLNHKHVTIAELRDILRRAAALLCRVKTDQSPIVHHLVGIPFAVFSKQSIKLGISLWTSVIKENPRMESRVLVAIAENWESTVRNRRGIFSPLLSHPDPFYGKQEFAATDKETLSKRQQHIYNLIAPHYRLLQFLSSHFIASRLGKSDFERVYVRLIHITLDAMSVGCSQPLAREAYFHIILLGLKIVRFSTTLSSPIKWRFMDRLMTAALAWFAHAPQWSFGGNRLQIKAEVTVMTDVQLNLEALSKTASVIDSASRQVKAKQDLLSLLIASEQTRLSVWLHPLENNKKHFFMSGHARGGLPDAAVTSHLRTAWAENPAIAVNLPKRFQSARLVNEVRFQILNFPQKVLDSPDALELLLGSQLPPDVSFQLKYLLYWAPLNPITAVTLFMPSYGNHPFIIQYAMRALESHSVDVMFFYVYQIVQTLRYDTLGYVERYIIETAKFSQLFAHQIIWNMKANAYKDEASEIPDPVKPTLDKVMKSLESSFSKEDHEFYEREFAFFNEVTGISGTLRSVLHESKEVKKQKIEEELRKIEVEVGVYLPSNPDGQVIGIDRKSGKPLQSHAKTPFMATFRIRKNKPETGLIEDLGVEEEQQKQSDGTIEKKDNTYETWLSAIFKVGDDCRQDVLALQMIAAFRGIFNTVGLDVWVFPYRVTATAPGCGVIDVLPNSISRDMLGREAVNRLDDYFVSRYGNADSIKFQEARSNFVKSMAAYSVISYLLQFKDRHNGNIMIDDAGHIIHIDFGFCFDIAPGGIKFERAPFKLTAEMIAVMGGSTTSQPYRWFEELTIKAFLAARMHCEHLCHIVEVMLDSGLPCFKPETMRNFRDRFVLERSEREAAEFMRGLIQKSASSYSTGTYDRFQLMTNGIPY